MSDSPLPDYPGFSADDPCKPIPIVYEGVLGYQQPDHRLMVSGSLLGGAGEIKRVECEKCHREWSIDGLMRDFDPDYDPEADWES